MRHSMILLVTALLACAPTLVAQQNPFAPIGREAPLLTLTKGQYPEVFTNDTLRVVCGIVYNRVTRQVMGFVEVDTVFSESGMRPELVSRWLSMDPLAGKYPEMTPYHFGANNPIYYIDPDGRAIKPANQEAARSVSALMASLGGRDLFGLSFSGRGKNEVWKTELNMNARRFERRAEGTGLTGTQLQDAVSLFKVLRDQDIHEIAIVSSETQSYVENPREVRTNNNTFNQFMTATDQANALDGSQTQALINGLLPQGTPNGTGFGYFPDQSGTTLTDNSDPITGPVEVPISGILVISPPLQVNFVGRQQGPPPQTREAVLQQGINSVADGLPE